MYLLLKLQIVSRDQETRKKLGAAVVEQNENGPPEKDKDRDVITQEETRDADDKVRMHLRSIRQFIIVLS